MSKVIAARVKKVLPSIIHYNQTGYVKFKKKCCKTAEDDLVLPQSFFFGWQEIQCQLMPTIFSLQKIHQGVEYFDELNWSRCQPRKTIKVSEIPKMNPILRYFLSPTLKLASNHLDISSSNWYEGSHGKGTLIEFSSRIILTLCLSHGDQSFHSAFNTVYVQVHN